MENQDVSHRLILTILCQEPLGAEQSVYIDYELVVWEHKNEFPMKVRKIILFLN